MRITSTHRRLGAAALAATLMAAGTARAATPANLGTGSQPSVVTDAAGRAYVAWIDQAAGTVSDPAQLWYCKVAAGASGCAGSVHLNAPSSGSANDGRALIRLTSAGTPTILASCPCGGGHSETAQVVTHDGGASFEPRPGYGVHGVIGDLDLSQDAYYDPSSDVLFDLFATRYATMPTSDSPFWLSPFGGGATKSEAVSLEQGLNTVAAFAGPNTGSDGAGDDLRIKYLTPGAWPGDAGAWLGGDVPVGKAEAVAMATGPDDVALLSTSGPDGLQAVQARRWNPHSLSFSAPVTIASAATGDTEPTLPSVWQDPGSGRLHAAWYQPGANPKVDPSIRYATSGDGGQTWTAPHSLVDILPNQIQSLQIAGDAQANVGRVVWAAGASSAVRTATLDPLPNKVPAGPPSPPASGSTGSPGGGSGAARAHVRLVGYPASRRLVPASLRVRGHGRRRRLTLRIAGRLVLPPGVAPASASSGRLTVTVRSGGRRVVTAHAAVSPRNCRFSLRRTFAARRVKHRRIMVRLAYSGTAAVAPASYARTVRVRG